MSDKQIQEIAENAKIIVSGYAFSIIENGFISILNLEYPSSAMVTNSNANYIDMYKKWKTFGGKDFFEG